MGTCSHHWTSALHLSPPAGEVGAPCAGRRSAPSNGGLENPVQYLSVKLYQYLSAIKNCINSHY